MLKYRKREGRKLDIGCPWNIHKYILSGLFPNLLCKWRWWELNLEHIWNACVLQLNYGPDVTHRCKVMIQCLTICSLSQYCVFWLAVSSKDLRQRSFPVYANVIWEPLAGDTGKEDGLFCMQSQAIGMINESVSWYSLHSYKWSVQLYWKPNQHCFFKFLLWPIWFKQKRWLTTKNTQE